MAGKFVDVTLRLIDKMTSPLNSAGQALSRQAQQIKRAGKEIQKAGKQISAVGGGMTKNFTIPIAGAGVAAIKLASDFESGMSKVSSISGATGGELDKLSKKAKEMGAKTKFSATEATDAYQYMAMAGWKTKDMLNGIEPVMKLAGASGEELSTTSDILTDSLTAFGKSAKDASKFADVMAAVSSNANTNVSMMGESFKYCAPVAGALGFSMEDTSKAIGLMANSGIKASNAGTALRSWMSRMAAPTDAVQSAMKKLGISLTDSKGQMKSFDTIMRETKKAFSGLTEEQKSQYASIIAGKTGMSGMLAVVNSSDKDFKKLTNAVKESDGACNRMYKTANDNLNGQLTVLKSTLESIAISFGEKLTPYVKKATEWLQKMANKFNGLSSAQKDMIIKVALVAAAIGPCILVFGKMVTSVGKVVGIVGKVGGAFKTFGSIAGMLASPAGVVIGVLAGIAVAAVLIYKNWDKLKPIFEKVVKALAPIKAAFEKIAKQVIKATQNMIKKVGPVIKSMQKTIVKTMPVIQKAVVSAFKKVQPVLKMAISFIGKVGSVVSKVLKNAIKAAMPVVKKMGATFNAVFPVIANIVSNTIGLVSDIISKLAPVFKVAFSVAGEWVSFLGNTISSIFSGIMTTVGGILDFITGVFTGNWEKAWNGVKDIFSGIFSSFATIAKAPINAVISIINGAIKGINKVNVDVPDWVPGMGGKKFGFNIPTIPTLAKGTDNWKGGIVQVSEKGGEIIDLPKGSRVYPHDKSVQKAYKDGARSGGKGTKIIIPKLADSIIVREEADIDRIVAKLADKLEKISDNIGGEDLEYIY